MDDVFITRDLGIAATLIALGYKLLKPERRENIVYFTFSKKEECDEVSRKFELRSEPILVDAAEYFDAIQRLKRQIFKLTESLGVPKKYSYS